MGATPPRPPSPLRGVFVAAVCAALWMAGAGAARAQRDGDGGAEDVKVTAVIMEKDAATRADVTRVLMGLRRGLREQHGVRFVDATDLFDAEDVPREVVDGLAFLDQAAAALRKGDGAKVQKKLRAVVDVFEKNLEVVKRNELVDAYLLLALTECGGAAAGCDAALQRVVAFREDFDYDVTRYPEAMLDRVERVRASFRDTGPRGSMEIKAEPDGAEIFVDGRSYGPSPAVVPGLLAGGHYVTAKSLGFGKRIERVEVRGDDVAQVMMELPGSDRALLLGNDLPRIELELGQSRAGKAISGMSAYLYAGQVILGTLHRTGDDVSLALYLYDLRTRFLLAQEEAKFTHDDDVEKRSQELAQSLYRGVDLSGAVAAPVVADARREEDRATPFYAAWWFWTAVGVVAVSGGIAVGVAVSSSGGGDGVPSGWTRIGGVIE